MRKKFLSALLFGVALTTATGTFVSCKDYDDDIDNLQEQINKLATADELKASISDLNAAISAAKSEAEAKAAAAQATADAAKQGADAAAAKVAELEANGATKAEVEAAQEVANAAKTAADNAAAAAAEAAEKIAAQATEITALANRIQTLENKVGGMTNEAIEADITELQEAVEEIKAEMEKLGVTTASVTAVSLYGSVDAALGLPSYADNAKIDFIRAEEKDNKFGVDNNAFVFKKGNVTTTTDEIYVRVSPTTADLSKASISLINSQGVALSCVTVDKVEKVTALIGTPVNSRAAGDNNGLWKITVKLQENQSESDFKAATQAKIDDKDCYINFAVAVSNTNAVENEAERRVISAYDVTVAATPAAQVSALNFKVNNAYVGQKGTWNNGNITWNDPAASDVIVKNRWDLKSANVKDANAELTWTSSTVANPTPATEAIRETKDGKTLNVQTDTKDNRSLASALRVELNKDIKIAINVDKDGNVVKPIKGFYVTLDRAFADKTANSTPPTEINAWNSYSYKGVYTFDPNSGAVLQTGTMFKGNTGNIQITNMNNVLGDEIGFRVYAVNLDGTLVDPDGKAFYVSTANENQVFNPAGVNATIAKNGASFVAYVPITKADLLNGDASYTNFATGWSMETKDAADQKPSAFNVTLVKADKSAATSKDDMAYAKITLTNALAFIDDATYTISKSESTTTDSKTYKLTFTKVMPDKAPADFSAKDKQIVNGVYTCYVAPKTTSGFSYAITEKTDGSIDVPTNLGMPLENAFNIPDDSFQFSFASSLWKDDAWKTQTVTGSSASYPLTIDQATLNKGIVDGKTQHETKVSYNYGDISKRKIDGKWSTTNGTADTSSDHKTLWVVDNAYETFNTVYACWHNAQTNWEIKAYTYTSTEKDNNGNNKQKTVAATTSVTYGYSFTLNPLTIKGTNSYNNTEFGRTLYELATSATTTATSDFKNALTQKNYLKVVEASLTTDATGKAEYFKVGADLKFTPERTDMGSNPAGDVASTLTIKCKDCFNHDVVIKLPFTVKKQ